MKFTIENIGCQMNNHDMERMRALLIESGLTCVQEAQDADIVIVNTCCVREKAEQKFYSRMGRLRSMKRKKGTILALQDALPSLKRMLFLKGFLSLTLL
jgi:tRNA-2-methylthio-N6-dimethylallyladenosine synthase